jgi:hypothetical protein
MSLADIKQLKEGDLFYEQFGGDEDEFVVLTTPKRNQDGLWEWTARPSCGVHAVIDFAIHEQYLAYGPSITLYPEFH